MRITVEAYITAHDERVPGEWALEGNEKHLPDVQAYRSGSRIKHEIGFIFEDEHGANVVAQALEAFGTAVFNYSAMASIPEHVETLADAALSALEEHRNPPAVLMDLDAHELRQDDPEREPVVDDRYVFTEYVEPRDEQPAA